MGDGGPHGRKSHPRYLLKGGIQVDFPRHEGAPPPGLTGLAYPALGFSPTAGR